MISVRRLLEDAQEARHSLTARQQARVHLERSGHAADITVSRQTFDDLTQELLDRAQRAAEAVLARSGLAWRDLAHVLVIGGATRMPAVGKMLESLTGLKPAPNIHPEEAVARGAALYAEYLLAARDGRSAKIDLEITDMTGRSLGVEWIDQASGRAENAVIIQRGTELPCAAISKIATTVDAQTSICVQLLEGESRDADECARIAEVVLRDLPVGLPKGWPIEVQYRYDATGQLEVKAHIEKTGRPLTVEMRHQGVLTPADAADWRKLLVARAGLKAILDLLGRHRRRQAELAPSVPAGAAIGSPAVPAAQAVTPNAQADLGKPPSMPLGDHGRSESYFEDVDLDFGELSAGNRIRKTRLTPRNVAIMLVGYVVSAALGLAIGYYILMRIDPSYNWLHLRLPGLSP